MSDYIDREAFLDAIERMKRFHQDADDIAEMLQNFPAADVQPVVLCRDCMHADYAGMPEGRTWCCEMERAMSETEYCSRGKRWEDYANDV